MSISRIIHQKIKPFIDESNSGLFCTHNHSYDLNRKKQQHGFIFISTALLTIFLSFAGLHSIFYYQKIIHQTQKNQQELQALTIAKSNHDYQSPFDIISNTLPTLLTISPTTINNQSYASSLLISHAYNSNATPTQSSMLYFKSQIINIISKAQSPQTTKTYQRQYRCHHLRQTTTTLFNNRISIDMNHDGLNDLSYHLSNGQLSREFLKDNFLQRAVSDQKIIALPHWINDVNYDLSFYSSEPRFLRLIMAHERQIFVIDDYFNTPPGIPENSHYFENARINRVSNQILALSTMQSNELIKNIITYHGNVYVLTRENDGVGQFIHRVYQITFQSNQIVIETLSTASYPAEKKLLIRVVEQDFQPHYSLHLHGLANIITLKNDCLLLNEGELNVN